MQSKKFHKGLLPLILLRKKKIRPIEAVKEWKKCPLGLDGVEEPGLEARGEKEETGKSLHCHCTHPSAQGTKVQEHDEEIRDLPVFSDKGREGGTQWKKENRITGGSEGESRGIYPFVQSLGYKDEKVTSD